MLNGLFYFFKLDKNFSTFYCHFGSPVMIEKKIIITLQMLRDCCVGVCILRKILPELVTGNKILFSPGPQINPGKAFRIVAKFPCKPEEPHSQYPVRWYHTFNFPYLGSSLVNACML